MAYLMRKITLSKWIQEQHDGFCADEINAESLSDLCADENAISTWYIGNKTEEEIQQAVLALVSGFRTLDEIKIVFLDENGKPEEALAKKQRLVSALKKDFRKEIDI